MYMYIQSSLPHLDRHSGRSLAVENLLRKRTTPDPSCLLSLLYGSGKALEAAPSVCGRLVTLLEVMRATVCKGGINNLL